MSIVIFYPAIISNFVPQNQALSKLSSVFGALLAETSWLLHQHALEAFAQFAEVRLREMIHIYKKINKNDILVVKNVLS